MADTPATGRHWLRGHRAALILTFDIDAESCMLAEGRRYAAHPNVMSHQAFGPLVGVPRILDMLKTEQVRATFFVLAFVYQAYGALLSLCWNACVWAIVLTLLVGRGAAASKPPCLTSPPRCHRQPVPRTHPAHRRPGARDQPPLAQPPATSAADRG